MSKKAKKIVASSTVACLVLSTVATFPASAATSRLAGNSRYETADAIVKTGWPTAKVAILASGEDANRVDALTVAPLSKKLDAPVVLVQPSDAAAMVSKLNALGVKEVYIANGTSVITEEAKAAIEKAGIKVVKRLGGISRVDTALNIAKELGTATEIVIANKDDAHLVDSLSIASIAAAKGMPIFLTDANSLDSSVKAYIDSLKATKVYVAGGTDTVSADIETSLKATRLAGAGRIETNLAILNAFKDSYKYDKVYVASANDNNLIDSLAGAPLAGKTAAPVVLVDGSLTDASKEFITKNAPKADQVIFGGTNAVSTAVEDVLSGKTSGGVLKVETFDGVKAVANNKVEVKFKEAQTGAGDVASYKIVEKGTNTAVEVKSVAVEGDKKVVLETAAMTSGKAYTLTADKATTNFTGIAKVTAAPKVDKIECVDTNKVDITFDSVLDKDSAETVANYVIDNGATVKSASLSSGRKKVTLLTEGVGSNKTYKVKINNVMNADKVAQKNETKQFAGKIDNTAPKLKGSIEVKTQNRIIVRFDDVHGVSKESAENVANYTIKNGSEELKIQSITAKLDKDDKYYDRVEIVTDTQATSKKYDVTIKDLVDGSTSANKITKDITTYFYGKNADTSAPTVDKVERRTNNTIKVVFTDSSALDTASALDINNYELNNDLKVLKAELKDADKPYEADGKTVILTTSSQEDKSYTLTVKDVKDEFGNALKPISGNKYRSYTFRGVKEDKAAPYVTKVESTDEKTVNVYFNELLDKASAEDPTNYNIKDIGTILKAEYKENDGYVKLTTISLEAAKGYDLTINGVKDLSGNAVANVKVPFIALKTTADIDAPKFQYAQAISQNELRVRFDEKLSIDTNKKPTIKVDNGVLLEYVDKVDDSTTLVFRTVKVNDKDTNPTAFKDGVKYTITDMQNVKDTSNNFYKYVDKEADREYFYGTESYNERPQVSTIEETNLKKIKVTFTEKIQLVKSPDSQKAPENWTIDKDDSKILYITSSNPYPVDKELSFNFSQYVTDLIGSYAADDGDDYNDGKVGTRVLGDKDKATKFTPSLVDEDKPVMQSAEAVNNKKVTVKYSEELETVGSYKVYYLNDKDKEVQVSTGAPKIDEDDATIVNIPVSEELKSDKIYYVKVLSGAKDFKPNVEDVKNADAISFPGVDTVATKVYLTGVKVIDADTVKVCLSEDYDKATTESAIHVYEISTNADGNEVLNDITTISGISIKADTATVDKLTAPVLRGTKYKVTVTNAGTDYSTTFEGIVDDSSIDYANNAVTFGGMSTDYSVVVDNNAEVPFIDGNYAVGTLASGRHIVKVINKNTQAIVYAKYITVTAQ